MGYVGLPLAAAFAKGGFRVIGVEANPARLRGLKRGASYVEDVPDSALRSAKISFTADASVLGDCEAVIICVQTPLRKSKAPNIALIVQVCEGLAPRLKRGQLVVLESTTYPGTTDEVVRPALEKGGRLKAGDDFHLAFSPERVDPGNSKYGITNTPKIVGGIDAESTRLAKLLYDKVIQKVVPVSSAKAAELVKLLENSFRAVNIALVNEMAQICERLGLDVWEVVGAAATKPFGFMPFWPGPGIGGHCIPKDPQLLAWKMNKLDYHPRFIELATKINGEMPGYAVARLKRTLKKDGRGLSGARILILGVAYKGGVSDYRESPSLDIMHLLAEQGALISFYDPFVPEAKAGRRRWSRKPLTDALIKKSDAVMILTAHPGIDYARVCRLARRVFDARNATAGIGGRVERL